MINIYYILLGLFGGVMGGLFGIGGGLVIIPLLVCLFCFPQKLAQGTSLALMIPPIGIFAVMAYYKQGNVDLRAAAFIATGFLLGGFLGAKLAQNFSNAILQKAFGVLLLIVSLRMIFGK